MLSKKLRRPQKIKQRAAIINRLVPKDAKCSDVIKWNPGTEKASLKRCTKHEIRKGGFGVSFSELMKDCDFDEDKTKKYIQGCIDRNDMHQADSENLYYWKRGEVSKAEVHKAGKLKQRNQKAIGAKEQWDTLTEDLQMEKWAQFAFLGKRLNALRDVAVEEKNVRRKKAWKTCSRLTTVSQRPSETFALLARSSRRI